MPKWSNGCETTSEKSRSILSSSANCASAFSWCATEGGARAVVRRGRPKTPLLAVGGGDGVAVGAAAGKSSHRRARDAGHGQPHRRHCSGPRPDGRHAQPRRFREGRRQHHRPLRVIRNLLRVSVPTASSGVPELPSFATCRHPAAPPTPCASTARKIRGSTRPRRCGTSRKSRTNAHAGVSQPPAASIARLRSARNRGRS
jgi:hypothetical protein